ncbi:ArgS-related anticodon-binding protein NrtL [Streptomyces sp. NPDC101733]|uniref:ArgS-related anticodon-binding protein NrtL n=1 Tax=unclassified Streptomyces TaxID=2593676 RepID=UPI00381002E9
MIPADLSRAVVRAVRRAVEDAELTGPVPGRVVVERTRPGGVGEYATPVALQVAKAAGRAPADVARVIAERLHGEPGIARVEITGPGFLNFTLVPRPAADLVDEVLRKGARYGYADDAVEVEPFRRLHPAEPRFRAVHEAVVRILRSQGRGDDAAPAGVAPVARRDGDVIGAYGADAATWAMLAVPARETPAFTAGLLVQDESNELFRVRYAHARARALTRNAHGLGFTAATSEPATSDPAASDPATSAPAASGPATSAPATAAGATAPASDPCASALLRLLAEYPLVLEAAAHHGAPERLLRHLVPVADALLDLQHQVLPRGDEKPSAAHRARLALAEAAGTVLAGGLALLGIDAPDFL